MPFPATETARRAILMLWMRSPPGLLHISARSNTLGRGAPTHDPNQIGGVERDVLSHRLMIELAAI